MNKKFYVRTYSNGSYAIEAPDVMSAINTYLGRTGDSVFNVHTCIAATEEGNG
jgi:antitoxin component HigA of HigAB toxin-antitoxin module